jgi:two-component system CheB/CheR fusion protein
VKFVFMDTTSYKVLQAELEASNSEVETAYEEVQSSNEELETTNEELHSTVEELETTNEELQSSNEELETMNEELHSTNEELAAVNESIRLQTEDLSRVNGYLSAILSGLGAGVIVLNRNLEVQLWNAVSEEQWGLRAAEVQGRHLLSLDIGLPVDRLVGQLRACLSGETDEATGTLDAHNRRGKAVRCTVRCRRLPAHDDIPQGAILLVETQEEVADNADGSNEAVRKE